MGSAASRNGPPRRLATLCRDRITPVPANAAPRHAAGREIEEICMKIHEYQAKELLAAEGAAIPKGVVVSTAAEAQRAFDDFGGKPVVLKAQVHAGGRGKGQFKGYPQKLGGVKYLTKRDDVAAVAA